MKKDMNELKKLVFDLIEHGNNGQLMKDHAALFHELVPDNHPDKFNGFKFNNPDSKPIEIDNKIEDVVHENEDESLSLDEKEKEMILKALKRNNNKRKYAASDLGISERTLYRKIKLYAIEEK